MSKKRQNIIAEETASFITDSRLYAMRYINICLTCTKVAGKESIRSLVAGNDFRGSLPLKSLVAGMAFHLEVQEYSSSDIWRTTLKHFHEWLHILVHSGELYLLCRFAQ